MSYDYSLYNVTIQVLEIGINPVRMIDPDDIPLEDPYELQLGSDDMTTKQRTIGGKPLISTNRDLSATFSIKVYKATDEWRNFCNWAQLQNLLGQDYPLNFYITDRNKGFTYQLLDCRVKDGIKATWGQDATAETFNFIAREGLQLPL